MSNEGFWDCPFCGEKEIDVGNDSRELWFALCLSCGAESSHCNTLDELRQWWNRRYAGPIPGVAVMEIDRLKAALAEATKAGTPYWHERDTMNGLVLANERLKAEVKLADDLVNALRSMHGPLSMSVIAKLNAFSKTRTP